MSRFSIVVSLISIAYLSNIGTPALQAQPYPSRPIQIVVPYDPGSAPRSKRCEASVCIAWRRAVRRMEAGSNHADSISTLRVFSVIGEPG